MSFQVNDQIYITPTGDTDIDAFLGQQMTIIEIIPTNDGGYRYDRYLLANDAGDMITVIDGEMEHCNNG